MIIKQMESLLPISESTLYPILKRLESNKLVSSYSVEHNGRLRKYYQITPNGIENLNEFVVSWKEVETIFNYIKGVSEND
jgi:PadR family transcriptional regulator PadR